ncbi:MAG: ABC transporter substrate-binding protein [Dehalococcoidia bacterium]|nr:ABC transporter substrate-binding protein [Dehalococcoidia bacterium]
MAKELNYWQRRNLNRRTFLYGTGVATAGLLTTVACGGSGDDDDDDTGDDTSAPAAEGTVRATPTPLPTSAAAKTGGTLNLMWNVADAQLDPHSSTEHLSAELYRAASHGLMKQKSVTEEPELDFATSIETPDGTTIVFKINPAAKWQNTAPVNGRQVTAEDVVYSLNRISTPGPAAPRASTFSAIESYTATDKTTVTVKLKQPFVPILYPLSDKWTVIVAPEVVEKHGDLKRGDSIVGFGPFIVEKADSATGVVLKKNPDYWGTPAYLDGVNYTTILDTEAALAAFRTGQIDVSGILPDLLIDEFRNNDNVLYEFDQVGVLVALIGGPNDRAPMNDERVRQAINLVIDRGAMGQAAWPGAKLKNAGLFSNPTWGIPEAEVAKMPGFGEKTSDEELKQAKDLMTAAGLGNGVEMQINTTKAYAQHHSDRAEALVPMLKRIGIDLKLNVMEYAAFKDLESKRDYQLTAATYAAYGDPNTPLTNTFTSTGTRNYWKWSDATYDAMNVKQQQESNKEARHKLILDMQRYLLKGTPVASNIWYQKTTQATKKKVKNFKGSNTAGSSQMGWFLSQIWLDA